MFEVGPVFEKNDNSTADIVVNQGGTDSGKTYAIIQVLLKRLYAYKYSHQEPEMIATIVGYSIPNIKKGPWRIAKTIVARSPVLSAAIKDWNKSERTLTFKNGAIMEFASYENEDDAKQGKRQYSFFNECNKIPWNIFWQVAKRTRIRTFIDYNPSSKFWVHSKLIGKAPKDNDLNAVVQLIISDHRHNPFLTKEQHEKTENIKDSKLWWVYARGKTGELEGQILRFTKVDQLPVVYKNLEDGSRVTIPLEFGFGIDIGYTTDKTAIVKVYLNGKDHYYQELLYKSNDEIQNEINDKRLTDEKGNPLTIEKYIKDILVKNGMKHNTYVWGDHDKSMSTKLRLIGVPYRMAKKGPNSVVASISSVKRYNGYTFNSPNIEAEIESYVWQMGVDILTGNEVSTGAPIDGVPDHLIAAIRYFEHSSAMRFSG